MGSADSLDDSLTPMAESLSECARLIDRTFTRVGDQLGEGLTLFDTLSGALGGLAAELAGSDMATTRVSLRRLAGELRASAAGLPEETVTLRAITGHNAEASRMLGLLREHLQLIAILAQSTRIEAASVQTNRDGLRIFSEKIVALTGEAKRTVEGCVRDDDRLTVLLAAAMARQTEFVSQYCDSLIQVAGKLERAIEMLDERMIKSLVVMKDAAAHSAKITMAVGAAIVAMQSGDSIRQRLEHCVSGLFLSIRAAARGSFPGADGSSVERATVDLLLRRIQTAQLREAGRALFDEIDQIDEALATLAGDADSISQLGRSLFGGKEESSGSFLHALEADLSEAAALIQKCDEARDAVDRATETLTNSLTAFQSTVVGLSETIQDIVMIGTNAGLMAVRLGTDGRGLVVIASELKAVADRIEKNARLVNPIFVSMQQGSSVLKDRDRGGALEMTALDRELRQSLAQMRESGSRVGAILDRLAKDGAAFGQVVDESRRSFAHLARSAEVIESAAEALDQSPSPADIFLSPADAADADQLLRQSLWPNYTMSAEREIHELVTGEYGISTKDDASSSRFGRVASL